MSEVTVLAYEGDEAFAFVSYAREDAEDIYRLLALLSDEAVRFHTPLAQAGQFEMVLSGFGQEPQVWDVTEPGAIRRLGVQASGGTYRVQVAVADPEQPRELIAFDGKLFFSADDGLNGRELWSSDGVTTEIVEQFMTAPGIGEPGRRSASQCPWPSCWVEIAFCLTRPPRLARRGYPNC